MKATYRIRAKVWLYPGKGGWHFVTIPAKQATEIRGRFGAEARGWGSLPVTARIGKTEWCTSIFPERQSRSYLLAIKGAVRTKERITAGKTITATFTIL